MVKLTTVNESIRGLACLAHPYCDDCSAEFGLVQQQEVMQASSLDDDMVDGDLGVGMGVRAAPSSIRKKSHSSAGVTGTLLPGAELFRCSSQGGEAGWIPRLKTAERQQRTNWKLPCTGKNVCELTLY